MKGAVDGWVVTVEKFRGGDTNCVSWANGPMAKIEEGPSGEYMLAVREVKESMAVGDCVAEGGSDWRKDTGEEGGAAKGSTMSGDCNVFSGGSVEGLGSGTSTACPILFLCLRDPKHQ